MNRNTNTSNGRDFLRNLLVLALVPAALILALLASGCGERDSTPPEGPSKEEGGHVVGGNRSDTESDSIRTRGTGYIGSGFKHDSVPDNADPNP